MMNGNPYEASFRRSIADAMLSVPLLLSGELNPRFTALTVVAASCFDHTCLGGLDPSLHLAPPHPYWQHSPSFWLGPAFPIQMFNAACGNDELREALAHFSRRMAELFAPLAKSVFLISGGINDNDWTELLARLRIFGVCRGAFLRDGDLMHSYQYDALPSFWAACELAQEFPNSTDFALELGEETLFCGVTALLLMEKLLAR